MEKLCFIVNPASRGGRNSEFLAKLERWRQQRCPESTLVHTQAPGHAIRLAQEAAANGCSRLIAVGGDGTLNEVVNGIGGLSQEGRPAIGVLSTGTGGDFARFLESKYHTPRDPSWLEDAEAVAVDFGKIALLGGGPDRERYFLNIADAGLSGEVVQRVNATKKRLGKLEYMRATLPTIFRYKPPRVRLSILAPEPVRQVHEFQMMMVVVANGRYFGGGMCIAPDEELNDQHFQLLWVEQLSYFKTLLQVPNVYLKKRFRHPKMHYADVTELRLESLDGLLPLGIDGEFQQAQALTFSLIPLGLKILVPRQKSSIPHH